MTCNTEKRAASARGIESEAGIVPIHASTLEWLARNTNIWTKTGKRLASLAKAEKDRKVKKLLRARSEEIRVVRGSYVK